MKILFVCDDFYPEPNASSSLAKYIIIQLLGRGVSCSVLNVSSLYNIERCVMAENITIFSVRNPYRSSIHEAKGIFKIGVLLCKMIDRLYPFRIKRSVSMAIEKNLKIIFSKENYDFIVPVVSDFNNGNSVMHFCIKNKKKYVLYQTDPLGTNYTQNKYKNKLEHFEEKLYRNSSAVIATPLLTLEKKNDIRYDFKKIFPLEFPNVVPRVMKQSVSKNKIICTFCGNLINGVRDCTYGLELCSRIKLPNLEIRIIGKGQKEILERFSNDSLKNQITLYGSMQKSESDVLISQSDFLINFDNVMPNQVPSKIFDYISTGIPIINFYKNLSSPSIDYLIRYGLCINLLETNNEITKEKQVFELKEFILHNVDKKKSEEDILKIFVENTPDFVGNRFFKIINNCFRK